MPATNHPRHVVVIGAGFTGLSAAYELCKAGHRVTVLESDSEPGGLAAGFDIGGSVLERFYHHWFTNDRYVTDLVEELGETENIVYRQTRTGMYYAKNFFRLSSPMDVLRFNPLGLIDRIRLGLLVFQVRLVKDWRTIEHLTAKDWLIGLCGKEVYRVVWEPLLVGKFGAFADQVSAVWFWKKLVLRGGSRAKGGAEMLAYYRGGFAALANSLAARVTELGGTIRYSTPARGLRVENGRVSGVETADGTIDADAVLCTPALPIVADLMAPHDAAYAERLRRVKYLANVCLVLQLDRSLSETYWLNVNDPSFPFVGIIEHTNFEPASSYGGKHIVYLSRYLPESDPLYRMDRDEMLNYALPHVQRMFPSFDRSWIKGHDVWRAAYAQPIAEPHYSRIMPSADTPVAGVHLATMAQIYPEDRGTNYAIRDGRAIGIKIAEQLASTRPQAVPA
ncbi:NAD(P)/FAD-dependent oxidoreductase [Azospirillum formosense]|uniref:NAD(P)/FAD-dependent oxidoreductase n=1 Tax=Azospirillum formosense TaxID=861533 RepID=UPI00338F2222